MGNEDETLRDNIDFLRESTMRLGRIRDELDEESELYGRLEGQICILDAVLELAADAPWAEDGTVRVPVREHRGAIAAAVRKLDSAQISIDDISVRRPTLDDVFLILTGHRSEAENGEREGDPSEREEELVG